MEYIYATLTLNELGQEINQDNISAVLEAAGADVVESRVKAIVAALEDVDIEQLGLDAQTEAAHGDQAIVPAGAETGIGHTELDEDPDTATDADAEQRRSDAYLDELFGEEETDETDAEDVVEDAADEDATDEDDAADSSEATGADPEDTDSREDAEDA